MSGFDDVDLIEQLPDLRQFAYFLKAEEPEDLVQETCRRALVSRESYKEKGTLTAWLFTIMHHILIDEARKAASIQLHDELVVEPAQYEVVRAHEIFRAISRMTSTGTSLLLPSAFGYSGDEMAAMRNIPLGTVQSSLTRARLAIHKKFNEDDET